MPDFVSFIFWLDMNIITAFNFVKQFIQVSTGWENTYTVALILPFLESFEDFIQASTGWGNTYNRFDITMSRTS